MYTTGLFEGDQISPKAFAFYIATLTKSLERVALHSPELNGKPICALLWADDLAIISKSAMDLQILMNSLKKYSDYWGLTVNTEKSKVIVFSKSKRRTKNINIYYGKNRLEVVDKFKYLGVTLSANLETTKTTKLAVEKVRKLLRQLIAFRWKYKEMPIEALLRLFETMLEPILLYGTELFACQLDRNVLSSLDTSQGVWCRNVLGVPRGTPACGVLYELGRSRVSAKAQIRALNFFIRISCMDSERLSFDALKEQKKMAEAGINCWGYSIKQKLEEIGHGYLWKRTFLKNEKVSKIKSKIKQRITDISTSEMMTEMKQGVQLKLYGELNKKPGITWVFKSDMPFDLKRSLAIFRLNCVYSNPIFKLDTERYECFLCGDSFPKIMVWDHFIRKCKAMPKIGFDLRSVNYGNSFSIISSNTTMGELIRKRLNTVNNKAAVIKREMNM